MKFNVYCIFAVMTSLTCWHLLNKYIETYTPGATIRQCNATFQFFKEIAHDVHSYLNTSDSNDLKNLILAHQYEFSKTEKPCRASESHVQSLRSGPLGFNWICTKTWMSFNIFDFKVSDSTKKDTEFIKNVY